MTDKWKPAFWFIIDVESIGLHGEGFQVAWVVIDTSTDLRVAELKLWCHAESARGGVIGRNWVSSNVPAMRVARGYCESPRVLRERFWGEWLEWKAQGAVMGADCPWPVEARFLIACVDEDPVMRAWEGPYPLIDIASVLAERGMDPLADHERREDEPKHCPLGDARQSARLFLEGAAPRSDEE